MNSLALPKAGGDTQARGTCGGDSARDPPKHLGESPALLGVEGPGTPSLTPVLAPVCSTVSSEEIKAPGMWLRPGIVYVRLCCEGVWPVAGKVLEGSGRVGRMGMAGSQGSHRRGSPHVISWKEIRGGGADRAGSRGDGPPHQGRICAHLFAVSSSPPPPPCPPSAISRLCLSGLLPRPALHTLAR